jgi:hypothetical protein
MDQNDFLKPHLKGERFEGAAIPLEMLRDLALLEEMVTEVAKWVYLRQHPGRTRSPRGFTGGVEFRLTRVEDGSAIPVISLDFADVSLPAMLRHELTSYGPWRTVGWRGMAAHQAVRRSTGLLPPSKLSSTTSCHYPRVSHGGRRATSRMGAGRR